MQRRFEQIDVFTDRPYYGNPLAVIVDADGLETEEMQRVSAWTNLSETTFLLPPTDDDADYLVRIFTPDQELPFAGHPTIGSCATWLRHGGMPTDGDQIVQQCGVGLVTLRRSDPLIAFAAPPLIRSGDVDEQTLAAIARALGISESEILASSWADNGPGWVAVMLDSAESVLNLVPDSDASHGLDIGVVGPYASGGDAAFEVRAFFPKNGVLAEDPVTGSLNASLAQWLLGTDRATAPYVASQGHALGRAGRVFVSQDDGGIVWIGGNTAWCVSGSIEI